MYYNKKYYIVAVTYSLPAMPTGMKGSNNIKVLHSCLAVLGQLADGTPGVV